MHYCETFFAAAKLSLLNCIKHLESFPPTNFKMYLVTIYILYGYPKNSLI